MKHPKYPDVLDDSIILNTCKHCMDIYKFKQGLNFDIHNYPDMIIVCIRGTTHIEDWGINIKCCLRENDIHRGFKYHAKSILTNLIMKNFFFTTTKKIILTGHSLGGATATVLADLLLKRRICNVKDVILITFGSPRPGGRSLKRRLKNLIHFRFVHGDDPVPLLPPFFMGYAHTHSKIVLKDLDDTLFDHIEDHNIKNYYMSLVASMDSVQHSLEEL